MIRTKQSAVTAISYGLIAALVAAVSIGALTAAGVDIENVFSISGNALSSVMVPNANLTSEQQSEITNSAAEIAAGTASAACLQYMNSSANATTMASNNVTCLGPGLNIAPPQEPVKVFGSSNTSTYPVFTYSDGELYAVGAGGVTQGETNLNEQGLWFYNDGFVMNNISWEACSSPNDYTSYYTPSTVATSQGTSTSCTGGTSTGDTGDAVNNTNEPQLVPLGYMVDDTW